MDFIPPDHALPPNTLPLRNTDNVLARAADIATHDTVALHFPAWTDGRAYSQAVLLRNRLRYRGRVLATGEVMADMLPLLRRCGFDAVQLGPGQSQAVAERALGSFDGHYQTVVHTPAARGCTTGP